ncbi:MAG: hypothetical protein JNK83_05230 [Rhizobiales bacterium]|nr:hypothetical protein [Hyphomicrobiales bacterium]
MNNEVSSQQQIAIRIAESATITEREALKGWVRGLLDIRSENISRLAKAKKALSITITNKVLWPMIKLMSREMKRYGWDNRSTSTRFGLTGAAVGIALFGGQTAGIAALGGAVGVPLWIVLSSGALFAHTLYSELARKSERTSSLKTTYTVIDAEKNDT